MAFDYSKKKPSNTLQEHFAKMDSSQCKQWTLRANAASVRFIC